MKNNNQYDELLTRYLSNEVDAKEAKTVESWIEASHENHRYFERLKNAWQMVAVKNALDYVLDEMNVDEKWKGFKQTVQSKKVNKISGSEQEQFDSTYSAEQAPVWKSNFEN